MLKTVVISDNEDFKNDLQMQMEKYITSVSFEAKNPDIIIVDESIEAYKHIRQEYPSVPIIMLAQTPEIAVDNLNIAVQKPFSLMKLLDIIRAANNRLGSSQEGYLFFGGCELRPNAREIVDLSQNKVIKLTEKEVDILKYLYKNSSEFVSKNDLQTNVWKYHEAVTTHTIETHIYRLRQKIETENGNKIIITRNGKYSLNME